MKDRFSENQFLVATVNGMKTEPNVEHYLLRSEEAESQVNFWHATTRDVAATCRVTRNELFQLALNAYSIQWRIEEIVATLSEEIVVSASLVSPFGPKAGGPRRTLAEWYRIAIERDEFDRQVAES